MPILADALQDAGCELAEILDHCRICQDHVLECWLIELLLDDAWLDSESMVRREESNFWVALPPHAPAAPTAPHRVP